MNVPVSACFLGTVWGTQNTSRGSPHHATRFKVIPPPTLPSSWLPQPALCAQWLQVHQSIPRALQRHLPPACHVQVRICQRVLRLQEPVPSTPHTRPSKVAFVF